MTSATTFRVGVESGRTKEEEVKANIERKQEHCVTIEKWKSFLIIAIKLKLILTYFDQ